MSRTDDHALGQAGQLVQHGGHAAPAEQLLEVLPRLGLASGQLAFAVDQRAQDGAFDFVQIPSDAALLASPCSVGWAPSGRSNTGRASASAKAASSGEMRLIHHQCRRSGRGAAR